MAEEDKKEENKEQENAEQEASSKDDEGSKSKGSFFKENKMMIMLGSVLFVLIIVISVLVYMLMKPKEVVDDPNKTEMSVSEQNKETKEDSEKKENNDTPGSALFIKIEPPFIVNFDNVGGAKFLQVTIEIMVRSEANYKIIESLMPIIKNDLIKLLSSQSYDELRTARGKELLRDRALKTVQDAMKKEVNKLVAEDILFTSFVMQ